MHPCLRFLLLLPGSAFLVFGGCRPAATAEPVAIPRTRSELSTTDARAAYGKTLTDLEVRRNRWREAYDNRSASATDRRAILDEARAGIHATLRDRLFPAWDGTPWDFSGTSRTPGEGSIACGYFVTTLVEAAGFRIPRTALAQQASQRIIRTLAAKEAIKVFSDAPMATVAAWLRESGTGVYVVGLDTHTGFVLVEADGSMRFVHASYFDPPRAVISEPIDSDNPLVRSRYRMFGRIFGDDLLLRWLHGGEIQMQP